MFGGGRASVAIFFFLNRVILKKKTIFLNNAIQFFSHPPETILIMDICYFHVTDWGA